MCRYFKKGQLIAIEGSIQTRSYQDKDGNKRKAFEVVASNVHFVESKKDSAAVNNNSNQQVNNYDTESYVSGSDDDFQEIQSDDDLPF